MKIAIIGAGGAGLCAARHSLQNRFAINIFEQSGNVGGIWNYTDDVGHDENGFPVHSSMYKNLRTNVPKELMTFEDFPYPELDKSYLRQEQVLEYIKNYTRKFELEPHIKFYKRVINIEPQNDMWSAEFEDVKTRRKENSHYNAVMVCNGHETDPFVPQILGIEGFTGRIKHSHDYRSPDCYSDKTVLVLGAGPSGVDISYQIIEVAEKVFLSYEPKKPLTLPDCLHQKPLVTKLDGRRAFFEDGTSEEIDDILFCTGYNYKFPFLSPECGIRVTNNTVYPLYKHIINIENPTMAFIGIPLTVCFFPSFGIQVRFFLSTLDGHFKLPSKEKMFEELHKEMKEKADIPPQKFHFIGDVNQSRYFDDLAETAQIKRVPPAISKLFVSLKPDRNFDACYRIIDDDNWEQIR